MGNFFSSKTGLPRRRFVICKPFTRIMNEFYLLNLLNIYHRLSLKRPRRKSSNKASSSAAPPAPAPEENSYKPCPGPPNIAPPPTPSLLPPQSPVEQREIVVAL